jgi:hypothetical protein
MAISPRRGVMRGPEEVHMQLRPPILLQIWEGVPENGRPDDEQPIAGISHKFQT